jgi:Nif-specific regulatory protein
LIQNDVESDPRYFANVSTSVGFPTHAILAVPMCIKERCVGVIEILNKKEGKYFDEEDLVWLEVFATQAAIAIENVRYNSVA